MSVSGPQECDLTGTRQGLQNEGAGNALLQVRAASTNVNAKAVVVVAMVVMMMVMITKIRPGHDGVIAMMMMVVVVVVVMMMMVKLRHLQRLLLSRGLRVISLERI
jgi:hypothetical protein